MSCNGKRWTIHLDPPGPTWLPDRTTTLAALTALKSDIDPTWLEAARAVEARQQQQWQQQQQQVVVTTTAAGCTTGGNETELIQQPPPDTTQVMSMIISRLGWRTPGGTEPLPLTRLTVRAATHMQSQPVLERRMQLTADFVREALGLEGPPPPEEVSRFRCTQARLWSEVCWENDNKETLWRLEIDGIPLPGNTHLIRMTPERCGCRQLEEIPSSYTSPRLHHFWTCPVARAVRDQIDQHLQPILGSPGGINRRQLWLAQTPEGCEQGPWDIITLAALTAMDTGRCSLRAAQRRQERSTREQIPQQVTRRERGQQQLGPRQRQITDFFSRTEEAEPQAGHGEEPAITGDGIPQQREQNHEPELLVHQGTASTEAAMTSCPVARAKARAVSDFWARLHSFAGLGVPRRGNWERVGPNHPIIAVINNTLQCADPVEITM